MQNCLKQIEKKYKQVEDIKFSIIVPAYKIQYLGKCIESILNQTYGNYELVIANDASPYDVEGIVKNYKDNRIKYHQNDINIGAVHMVDNWNKCLDYCTGDYVICMGDDDMLLSNCLASYRKTIEEYPLCKVFHIQTQMINENGKIIDLQSARPEYESVYSFIWHDLKGYREQYIGDFLFEINYLKIAGGFYNLPCGWHADRLSVITAAKEFGIANCPEYGFQYRVNAESVSASGYAVEKCDAYQIADKWYVDFFCESTCDDRLTQEDILFFDLIKKLWPIYYKKQVRSFIGGDFAEGLSMRKMWFWMRKAKKYDITWFDLLIAYCRMKYVAKR